jgi:hypothetical protein
MELNNKPSNTQSRVLKDIKYEFDAPKFYDFGKLEKILKYFKINLAMMK